MMAPANYKDLSDEQLLAALRKNYDAEAAQFVLDVLRGRIDDVEDVA